MSSDCTTEDLHNYCETDSTCDDNRINYTRITSFNSRDSYRSGNNRAPDTSCFASVITPLTNLNGFSDIGGCVEFRMRRKNKTVTLQWEPFSGILTANGVTHLVVTQNIINCPPYVMTFPIIIKHRGNTKYTKVVVDPFLSKGNVLIYLNLDGTSTDTMTGDTISVDGTSINWVVD